MKNIFPIVIALLFIGWVVWVIRTLWRDRKESADLVEDFRGTIPYTFPSGGGYGFTDTTAMLGSDVIDFTVPPKLETIARRWVQLQYPRTLHT